MATVIEALIVTLGLDGSAFITNAEKAKKKRAELEVQNQRANNETERQENRLSNQQARRQREADTRTKKTVAGFKDVRNEVLKLFAIFTAGVGIKAFVENTINSAVSLGYLSANLGMTTEKINAWQRASERAGGTAGGMAAQFKESADTLAQLKMGMGPSESLQWFFRLGGSSQDLTDGNKYLLARSKIIHEMFQTDPGKAALMAKQMGISEDQFEFIKQGPAAIEKLVAAQEKNSVISKRDAAAALELKNKWLDLRDAFQATSVKVLTALLPMFGKIADIVLKLTSYITDNKEKISEWLGDLADGIIEADWSKIIGEARKFAAAIVDIAKGIKEIAEAIHEFRDGKISIFEVGKKVFSNSEIKKTKEDIGKEVAENSDAYKPSVKTGNIFQQFLKNQAEKGLARWAAMFGSEGAKEFLKNAEAGNFAFGATAAKKMAPAATEKQKKESGKLFDDLENRYKLPSGILDSVWQAESGRGQNMLSPKGAMGHFQFMPKTAKEFGLKDPNNLGESADAAARKLKGLLSQYNGDVGKAAAAYNWGQGNLDKNGIANAPKETRDYMEKITQGVGQRNAVAVSKIPSGAMAASSMSNNTRNSTVTSETNITGPITINTKSTDVQGIAREFGKGVEKYSTSMNANTGIN